MANDISSPDGLLPFQRLDVYVAARDLARRVHLAGIRDAELRDQATRAAKSDAGAGRARETHAPGPHGLAHQSGEQRHQAVGEARHLGDRLSPGVAAQRGDLHGRGRFHRLAAGDGEGPGLVGPGDAPGALGAVETGALGRDRSASSRSLASRMSAARTARRKSRATW